jgi:uncharacterized repeat protein (TIGR03843 family)
MPWSSNATFLVTLGGPPREITESEVEVESDTESDEYDEESEDDSQYDEDDESEYDESEDDDSGEGPTPRLGLPGLPEGAIRGIYKPGRGERPLWDFPRGLYRREVAAYELSQWLGWEVIPPTVVRDSDYGPGSLQWFVETDFAKHYFTFLEDEVFHDQLKRMAVFDIVANNTDRKGGHVLADSNGHLWGIDNGLCFNEEPKLRTVIWDFAGQPIPADLIEPLKRLASSTNEELGVLTDHLSPDELSMVRQRAERLLDRGELPAPRSDHAYPWPLV